MAGRNVGQSTGFNAGVFYIMDFGKKKKEKKADGKYGLRLRLSGV